MKKQNKILNKIKIGEIKMKPRWEFIVAKWVEVGLWLGSIGLVVGGAVSIAYFLSIYDIGNLNEFGDIGIQIFYEDFPYIWGGVSLLSLAAGVWLMINTGNNYKRSWQRNLMIMSGIILILTIVVLSLGS